MARRSVTLAVEEGLLKEARHLAVERGMSLSALMAQTLTDLVRGERDYLEARERQRRFVRNAPDLGSGGTASWRRDDLHER